MLLVFVDEITIQALLLFKRYRQHKKNYKRKLEAFQHFNNYFGFNDEKTQKIKKELEQLNLEYYEILKEIKEFINSRNFSKEGRNDIEIFINYVEENILFNMWNFNPRKNVIEIIQKELNRLEQERNNMNLIDNKHNQ